MPFDIVTDTIDQFLDNLAKDYPVDIAGLLRLALTRPLRKHLANQPMPFDLVRLEAPPPGAAGWLRLAFDRNRSLYGFSPDALMRGRLRHVADWIAAAVAADAPWLGDCDAAGRPRKLLRLGSLDQAFAEADKAMRLASNAHPTPLGQADDEPTVMSFADGSRMVALLTPEALDRESRALGHCIGNGAYDHRLASGTHRYFSLRDRRNKAHATLEIDVARHTLVQCRGKQNLPPVPRHMPAVQAFLVARRFALDELPHATGLIEQDGCYHDVTNLPANFQYRRDLDLTGTQVTALPPGLRIDGDLDLSETAITSLPAGLDVHGGLYLWKTAVTGLPGDLRVGGDLFLSDTALTSLPPTLRIGGGLYLGNTAITEFPKLDVGGELDLAATRVTKLPDHLHVGGDLKLATSAITALPDGLSVGGDLDLTGTRITSIPATVTVRGRVVGLPRHTSRAARAKRRPAP